MEFGWLSALVVLADFAFRVGLIVFILLRRRKRPTSTLAWVVVILVVPILGSLLYLLLGEVRLGRRRLAHHHEIAKRIRRSAAPVRPRGTNPTVTEIHRSTAGAAESAGGMPPKGGNRLELLHDSARVIEALVRDIDAATDHCHLLYYIYLDDGSGQQVAEALLRARQRGVACRVLVDDVGSRAFLKSPLAERLRRAGVRVVGALPANLFRVALSRLDLRNHRKLAVFDGRIGYTGSQNIADRAFAPKPRFAPWVDATIRIVGPAVRDLQELFIADWYLDTGEGLERLLQDSPPYESDGVTVQVIPSGPDIDPAGMQQMTLATMFLAKEELILTTPYFVPGEAELAALCSIARSGVATLLVVPLRNDSPLVGAASRSHYPTLLEAGVQIYEYRPGLLHAKTMTIDRSLGMVTTANFDRRSFELNFEVTTLIYDSDFASQLRFLQRSYVAESQVVDETVWRVQPWPKRLGQNVAGLFSPLL